MTDFKRIFLDTAPIIYYVERKSDFFHKIDSFLRDNETAEYVTSVVSIAEYFPHPFMEPNKEEVIRAFDRFIDVFDISIINVDRRIAEKSAEIRSEYRNFKGMDALQLATAVTYGCDCFLTNDHQLRQYADLRCITLLEV